MLVITQMYADIDNLSNIVLVITYHDGYWLNIVLVITQICWLFFKYAGYHSDICWLFFKYAGYHPNMLVITDSDIVIMLVIAWISFWLLLRYHAGYLCSSVQVIQLAHCWVINFFGHICIHFVSCAAILRQKLQLILALSPSHSVLTPGQTVQTLTLQREVSVWSVEFQCKSKWFDFT